MNRHRFARSVLGPLWIILAASIWAADVWVRVPLSQRHSAFEIVALEHAIAFTALAVVNLWRDSRHSRIRAWYKSRPRAVHWFSLFVMGLGSALGTALFTWSFTQVEPSVAMVLQRWEPIWVVVGARLWLREKLGVRFYLACGLAWGASIVLVDSPKGGFASSTGGVLAISGAVILWAAATLAARKLVSRAAPGLLLLFRHGIGCAILGGALALRAATTDATLLAGWDAPDVLRTALLGLGSGVGAFYCYYRGLRFTTAGAASWIEQSVLLLAALAIGVSRGTTLSPVQVLAAGVLLAVVTAMARSEASHQISKAHRALGLLPSRELVASLGESKPLLDPSQEVALRFEIASPADPYERTHPIRPSL